MHRTTLIAGLCAALLVAAVIFFQSKRDSVAADAKPVQDSAQSANAKNTPEQSAKVKAEPQQAAPLNQGQEPVPSPMGDAPAPVAESSTPIRRATPEDLLAGLFDARAREDLAYLARLTVSPMVKPQLDTLDESNAYLAYVWKSGSRRWDLVKAAFDANTIVWDHSPDKATAIVPAGPSLGSLPLTFVRLADGWYLGSPE